MSRHAAVSIAALLIGALVFAQGTPPAAPLVLLSRDGRRPLSTTLLNGQELIALDDLASVFQVTVREDPVAGGLTVSYKGKTIVLSTNQAMASVAGRLVALPAAPLRSGRRWLVPVEFLSRALSPIYDTRLELRKPSRLVVLGDLRVPRISARFEQAGTATRLILDVAPLVGVVASADTGRLLLRVQADALDVRLPLPGEGLIEQLRQGDQPGTLVVALRPGAGTPRLTTTPSDTGSRVTIDVSPAGASQTPQAPVAAAPSTPPSPSASAPQAPSDPTLLAPRTTFQAIVIDPGHGGDDDGVKGPGGVVEKELTLEIARRVKAQIEMRLGIRVTLTREDDRAVTPDERAATANNGKADLFLSLHFNAALAPSVRGAEVFHVGLDREGEDALKASQAESVALPALGGSTRALDLIRWDMAQARHIQRSTVLASMLEELLRAHVPMGPRPLQQAPMRTLVGVDMPAALIEMAYLTNNDQAKGAASADFQTSITQAIYDAVLRFRGYLEAAR